MERSQAMKTLLRRENSFKLFRALNSSILSTYLTLKSNYNFNTPPTAEIIVKLKVILLLVSNGKHIFNKKSDRKSVKYCK
jgi:hypothetical protein